MKTYLLLGIAAALVSAARGACDACVDGRCLRKHSLPDGTGGLITVGSGDINRNTNVYYVITTKNDHGYITQCNLSTLTCNDTANSWGLTDIIVDQRTGDVYATGSEAKGFYKVDLVKNERALVVDEEIKYMTFKEKLYYAPWYNPGIYTNDGGIQRMVPGTEGYVDYGFVVDKNDDIYCLHDNDGNFPHIRQLKNGTGTANYFCDQYYSMSIDKDGNAMFISMISHAVNRVINDELVEVGAVTDLLYRPLFDGDNNIIYSIIGNPGRYYLKQATDEQCSTVSGNSKYRQITSETIRTTTPETIESTFTSTTPAHEPSNTPDDNNTSNTNQQQTEEAGQQDQTCTCNTPKLPIVTVKIEFN